jgi:hypothetical protein
MILRTASRFAVRRKATVLRPSLGGLLCDEFLYFGVLRGCSLDELVSGLRDDEDLIEKVCWQFVVLSRLALAKHRLVHLSLRAATFGVVCTTGAVLVAVAWGAR